MITLYRLETYNHRVTIYAQKTWKMWPYQYILSEWGATTHIVDWYLVVYTEAWKYTSDIKTQIYDYGI